MKKVSITIELPDWVESVNYPILRKRIKEVVNKLLLEVIPSKASKVSKVALDRQV